MVPLGDLQFTQEIKEPLVEEIKAQTLGKGIVPIMSRVEKIEKKGRSGNFRKLGVPGENKEKVFNRLHDPTDFEGKNVLVVGGGDSALETSIAIARAGGSVTHSYRKEDFSRPKPDNVEAINMLMADPMADVSIETPSSERVTTSTGDFMPEDHMPGKINLLMKSQVKEIEDHEVTLIDRDGNELTIPNDAVFTMIGREAPLDFFRRSKVKIKNELGIPGLTALIISLIFFTFIYNWKAGGSLTKLFQANQWFPYNLIPFFESLGSSNLIKTLAITLEEPGFYYSLLYTSLVIIFGILRIRRRKTSYITLQTISLTLVQLIPLFILPYFILPILGSHGFFDSGIAKTIADSLFPEANYGHGREYWRAFGFILAWPLFIWNVFSEQPLWGWLVISVIQTFVIIPLMIYYWGKGAYCGWICSCGAMAETLGDTQRHKMPHGAKWNRVNMIGQVILAIAFIILITRIISWSVPDTAIGQYLNGIYTGLLYNWKPFGIQLNYKWVVDLVFAGIIGYGLYFWYSGRVWCRFMWSAIRESMS